MATEGSGGSWYRISLEGISGRDAETAELNGNYWLGEATSNAPNTRCWEVSFPPKAGFQTLRLEVKSELGAKATARLFFVGSSTSPIWSQTGIEDKATPLQLTLETKSRWRRKIQWPAEVSAELVAAVMKSVGRSPNASRELLAFSALRETDTGSGSPPVEPPECPPVDKKCESEPCCPKMSPTDPMSGEDMASGEENTNPSEPSCDDSTTPEPVTYSNGQIQLSVTDVSAEGFGRFWGHVRSYSNQLLQNFDFGNGYNWLVRQWAYVTMFSPSVFVVTRGSGNGIWFDKDDSDDTYTARYGAKQTLVHSDSVFQFATTSGELWEFNDFDQVTYPPGSFKSMTTTNGDQIAVITYVGSNIGEVQRSFDSVIESFVYEYVESGNNAGRLSAVSIRRTVDNGTWTNISRVFTAITT